MAYAMPPAELLGIMRRRGVSIARLANELGKDPEAVKTILQKPALDDVTACAYMDALQDIKKKGVQYGTYGRKQN